QSFISHGLYDHLLELAGVFLVWYSFWHIKSPHLLVLYHMSNKWGAVQFAGAFFCALREKTLEFFGFFG
ncbi:MAG: hypothetical protein IKI64_00370, partial [Clostridia bacterium]|nr:hypothetical protein [Clostridia bacterium]